MDQDSILKLITHIEKRGISTDSLDLAQYFKYSIYKKNEHLLRQNESNSHFYFIITGSILAYHLDSNFEKKVIMMGIDDWWITDMYSFDRDEPSIINLMALEPTESLPISKAKFEDLLFSHPPMESFFRKIFQKAYLREQRRSIHNLSLSAEDRYKEFIRTYPLHVNKVPLKFIASYIGVTPEFLSVIRARRK